MTTRFAPDLILGAVRKGLLALICALALPLAAQAESPGSSDDIQLSAEEVRHLAAGALRAGDNATAIRIARGLLKADPEDPIAYFILSMAHAALGETTLSRKAARYAFQYADDPGDRVRAGQLAAKSAVAEERYSLAQLWLRRSAIHAVSDAEKAAIAQDYQALRRLNPWSMRLNLALRPSSNVNNGSEDALQIIDGVPVTGILSGSAQALSGLIATADLSLRYRFQANQTSATYAGLRLYTKHIALSSSAKAKAPGLRNSDLSQQFLETSVDHARKLRGGILGGTLATGQSWYGNNPTYRFVRASARRVWELGTGSWIGVSGTVEDRNSVTGQRYDATAQSLTVFTGLEMGNGDQLTMTLGLRDTDAWFINDRSQAASLRAAYAFDQPMGPVKMDVALTLGYADYPDYRSGFIVVPGGRQDRSVYADVNLMFDDWDYAGFSPSLRIRAGRTSSNDSRFKTREFSVGLGIESKF
ncbi:tetratricopeptide repeat protein [Aestuariivita boseongensis]|uniref:tetratricopeptide repeat protein n=1 Tax=Aestuariivita boseongensis TaxID=1470562 RepID=UPI0012FCA621|nr:hypothetical protein [Aestuariivita boseongensis]